MPSLEMKKILLKKDLNQLKIAWHNQKQKENTEKRETKTKNEKKSNNSNQYFFFYFYFFILKIFYFVNIFGKTYIATFVLDTVFSSGRLLEKG